MSFSSRLIAEPAPPVCAHVRRLGLMLWALPILLSLIFMLFSSTSGSPLHAVKLNDEASMNRAVRDMPALLEPETFARIGGSALFHTALGLLDDGGRRFPVLAEPWKSSAFQAGKMDLRAQEEPLVAPVPVLIPLQAAVSDADTIVAAIPDKTKFDMRRSFRRVKVIGATALLADNIKIVLAGIAPHPAHVMCKRLDGVMQSCVERAQHRLAILLQARSIVCELTEPLESGVHIGRCMADRIDIAEDLLRQKLAQKGGAILSASSFR